MTDATKIDFYDIRPQLGGHWWAIRYYNAHKWPLAFEHHVGSQAGAIERAKAFMAARNGGGEAGEICGGPGMSGARKASETAMVRVGAGEYLWRRGVGLDPMAALEMVPCIERWARRYQWPGLLNGADKCDLAQAGFLGAAKAAKTFDPARGAFGTWAQLHIRTEMQTLCGYRRTKAGRHAPQPMAAPGAEIGGPMSDGREWEKKVESKILAAELLAALPAHKRRMLCRCFGLDERAAMGRLK
jgi:DNA-directed RNA polymerase specialized sigma24 family protein